MFDAQNDEKAIKQQFSKFFKGANVHRYLEPRAAQMNEVRKLLHNYWVQMVKNESSQSGGEIEGSLRIRDFIKEELRTYLHVMQTDECGRIFNLDF